MLLSCATPVWATDPAFVLPEPTAPIFTIAGGGTAAPRAGALATDVSLHPREAVYLPDGRIVIRDGEFSGNGRLVGVGVDGRIIDLPPFPPRPVVSDPVSGTPLDFKVYDIDIEVDGSLLALVTGEPSVMRLDVSGWAPVAAPPGINAIGARPDGGLIALTDDGEALWMTRDGAVVARRALPTREINGSREFTEAVVALPGGAFVAGSIGGVGHGLLGRPGFPYVRLEGLGGDESTSTGFPTGPRAGAYGPVAVVSPDGKRRRLLYGTRPGLGPGDGGTADRANLDGVGVSAAPTGAVLVAQPTSLRHDVPVRLEAFEGPEISARYPDADATGTLRWIGRAPAGRLFAAIAPAAYRRLATGEVPVVATVAGEARIVVRSGRRIVADVRAVVPAGRGDVPLGRRLPAGDYAIELTVTSGPQNARHRLGVTTRRILPWREARTAIRQAVDDDISGDGGGGGRVLHRRSMSACGTQTRGMRLHPSRLRWRRLGRALCRQDQRATASGRLAPAAKDVAACEVRARSGAVTVQTPLTGAG